MSFSTIFEVKFSTIFGVLFAVRNDVFPNLGIDVIGSVVPKETAQNGF
jgi:hypothetical protein